MAQGQPCKEEATAFPEAGLFISSAQFGLPFSSSSRVPWPWGLSWGQACTNWRMTCYENPGLRQGFLPYPPTEKIGQGCMHKRRARGHLSRWLLFQPQALVAVNHPARSEHLE